MSAFGPLDTAFRLDDHGHLADQDATMDIGGWLRSLGLGHYEATFRENKIDVDVLPELTESDLSQLGVPLGDRKRFLKAIGGIGVAANGAATSGPGRADPSSDAAERRQLTVMFCDLVGSTAISARLDPEDMRQVIRAYQDVCSGIIARYSGFVAKFMGDGLLAYFGFPRAHEDDAERAVRAGLEIAAAVAKLETCAGGLLDTRIGIATGLVVVGELVGQGSAQEQAVVGDTPNLAARLQGLAEPGSMVVAASTRRLLGDLFELRDLGRLEIKGFAEPVAAWTVEGVPSTESRFEAARSARPSGFVGRDAESAVLLQRHSARSIACSSRRSSALSGPPTFLRDRRVPSPASVARWRVRCARRVEFALQPTRQFGSNELVHW